LTGLAGFKADGGGKFRPAGTPRGDENGLGSPGNDGTIDGLVIRSGTPSPSRLARPATALRV
jgi:hypothetical protein